MTLESPWLFNNVSKGMKKVTEAARTGESLAVITSLPGKNLDGFDLPLCFKSSEGASIHTVNRDVV